MTVTGDIIITSAQSQDWLPAEARHQPGGASPHIAQLTSYIQVQRCLCLLTQSLEMQGKHTV